MKNKDDVKYVIKIVKSETFNELDNLVKGFPKTSESLTIRELEQKIEEINNLIKTINESPDDYITMIAEFV